MDRQSFYFYRRSRIYYVRFYNEQLKKYSSGKSTGATNKEAARLVVYEWLKNGIPTGNNATKTIEEIQTVESIIDSIKHSELRMEDAERILKALKDKDLLNTGEGLISYLKRFWDYENSPYVKDKLAHGQKIGRRHAYDMNLLVESHWKPYFNDKKLAKISKTDLKDFSFHLVDKGLAPKTINNIITAGSVAFKYAFEIELIKTNPAAGLKKFSGKSKKRGILTEKEVEKLFSLQWDDERSRIGNLLAAATGMRAGEILGLRMADIGLDRINVKHSWSNKDGLKGTKTGEERTLPLAPSLRKEIQSLIESNPFGIGPQIFIFYSTEASQPMDIKILRNGLNKTLLEINPDRDYWKKRNIVFHSWRHRFSTLLANKTDKRLAMVATGHATAAVFEAYSSHETEEQIQELGKIMGEILPFKRK